MNENKSLTFINTEITVNTATSKLSVSGENYYTVTSVCVKVCLHVMSFSPFNAPFNGHFFISL